MKYLVLSVSEYLKKGKLARIDVAAVIRLRELPRPMDGTSFMVEKRLYVWVENDTTPHDGQNSIIPLLSAGVPGRYRLATVGTPLAKR